MPKYGSPSGKATWNEKRSSCGSGCKTLWLIKVYVTRVSRNLAELKSKNAHTVHIENGHKSLPSQRRKKLFLPLAMREPTPNQLAAILAHKQPRWLPKYVKEIERKGQERMMSPKRKYSNSLTVCLLFLKDSLDLKCPWWSTSGKTNPPWAGVHGINGYTQNLNSLPSQMRAMLLHEGQWVWALNEICILGAWFLGYKKMFN